MRVALAATHASEASIFTLALRTKGASFGRVRVPPCTRRASASIVCWYSRCGDRTAALAFASVIGSTDIVPTADLPVGGLFSASLSSLADAKFCSDGSWHAQQEQASQTLCLIVCGRQRFVIRFGFPENFYPSLCHSVKVSDVLGV